MDFYDRDIVVTGGTGRSEETSLGGELSFFGFFAILLLFCSPLGMARSFLVVQVKA